MIRTLLLIAGASLVLAAGCFAGAAALGGAAVLHRDWRPGHDGGPIISRQVAWTGGVSLQVSAPCDVQFTQAPGPARLVISGPQDVVSRISVMGSRIGYDDWGFGWRHPQVRIELTAPNVSRFALSGDNRLTITGFAQDQLDVDVSGRGDVTAQGRARAVTVRISGAGDVDMGRLDTVSADISISGAGRSTIAPTQSADVHISGAGVINLLTHPPDLRTEISGAGRINQAPASEAPPPSPTAPAKPRTAPRQGRTRRRCGAASAGLGGLDRYISRAAGR